MNNAVLHIRYMIRKNSKKCIDFEKQISYCKDLAKNKNCHVKKEFIEFGNMNKNILKNMLDYCEDEHNEIQTIIFITIKHFCKDFEFYDSSVLKMENGNNVEIFFAKEIKPDK